MTCTIRYYIILFIILSLSFSLTLSLSPTWTTFRACTKAKNHDMNKHHIHRATEVDVDTFLWQFTLGFVSMVVYVALVFQDWIDRQRRQSYGRSKKQNAANSGTVCETFVAIRRIIAGSE